MKLAIVLQARFGADGQRDLDLFHSTAKINVVCLDRDQAEFARAAFTRLWHRSSSSGAQLWGWLLLSTGQVA